MCDQRTFPLLLVLLCSSTVAAETSSESMAPELHRDPFESPSDRFREAEARRLAEDAEISPSEGTAKPRANFLWQPEIRGIIRSEDIAIVNIGGTMIGLGEEIEGYTLVRVKEKTVVFEKNGQKIPVSLEETESEFESL